ncbi:agmatine/peptidylarginine deiminase [Arthrobacter sp. UM1]|uniref:agmatine deiminase family protein n=1 Tax=Arthrobacter sp. UM1 TaxID=2766776 RepID=UPI001CF642DA|nr:agmatine deiminase family protein [Arthrobacter sp. UM1]MCB4209089.1 agmatine deiminase family protein [Arthrobacter sp. UM1]
MSDHAASPAAPAPVMPPEWAPHEATWMAYPTANQTFGPEGGEDLERARAAWGRVLRVIEKYEPVRLAVDPADADDAARRFADLLPDAGRAPLGEEPSARASSEGDPSGGDASGGDASGGAPSGGASSGGESSGHGLALVEIPLDDAWMRDSGPSFVHRADGSLAGVDWTFNGWGAQEWAAWDKDAQVGRAVAREAGVEAESTGLVNEGGGFHIDGRGTVLLTETVQMDPGRNPGRSREEIEREIHARLGTRRAVWLPRGLTRDYDEFGTRGHVDIVAAFTESGTVLLHRQDAESHPDHAVTRELKGVLASAQDARGEALRVVDVPAPSALTDDDGESTDWSYINHYVGNGFVALCAFDDPADAEAKRNLEEAYPGRTVELVDARDVFRFGGGIHCITQQQPAPRAGERPASAPFHVEQAGQPADSEAAPAPAQKEGRA